MVLIIVYISVFAAILIALLVIMLRIKPARKVDKNEKDTKSGTLVSKDTKRRYRERSEKLIVIRLNYLKESG